MTTEGNGTVYEVKYSLNLKKIIIQLHLEEADRGRGQQFLDALRVIHQRLRRDPIQFGEPLFHLRALKLVVYQAVVARVVVEYVVYEERPLVFLKDVKLLD